MLLTCVFFICCILYCVVTKSALIQANIIQQAYSPITCPYWPVHFYITLYAHLDPNSLKIYWWSDHVNAPYLKS